MLAIRCIFALAFDHVVLTIGQPGYILFTEYVLLLCSAGGHPNASPQACCCRHQHLTGVSFAPASACVHYMVNVPVGSDCPAPYGLLQSTTAASDLPAWPNANPYSHCLRLVYCQVWKG